MHRLQCGMIPIPTLYIAENRDEAAMANSAGIPYLIRPKGMSDKKILGYVLWHTLREKFPNIDWYHLLDIRYYERDELVVYVPGEKDCPAYLSGDDDGGDIVTDIAEDYREFTGGIGDDPGERDLDSYIGNLSAKVSIEQLQELGFLPVFLDDIAEAVKKNLYGLYWSEGYNKKRGFPLGNFDSGSEKPNLMILDVSGSIPKGVSATMLTLIDTLRTKANADLIITGSCSKYWAAGEELPDPQWIRGHIGYGNEASDFYRILSTRIAGRSFGNLICFGDHDAPSMYSGKDWLSLQKSIGGRAMEGTTVERLMSYHTCKKTTPGYALWAKRDGILIGEEVCDTSWVEFMR